jgi:VWFA-related protein
MTSASTSVQTLFTCLLAICFVSAAPTLVERKVAGALAQDSATPNPTVETLRFLAIDQAGNPITDLKAEDLSLKIDKQPRKISSLSLAAHEPRTIGLFFDLSRSRRSDDLIVSEVQETARFLESVWRPGDVAFVVVFNDAPVILAGPTTDLRQIQSALQEIPRAAYRGSTALYDALCSVRTSEPENGPGERLFIVVGDFEDNSSTISHEKMIEAMRKQRVRVFPLLRIIVDRYNSKKAGSAATKIARQVAEKTGGGLFNVENKKDLAAALHHLASEVQSAYRLAYEPGPAEGQYKHLQLQTNRSHVELLFAD